MAIKERCEKVRDIVDADALHNLAVHIALNNTASYEVEQDEAGGAESMVMSGSKTECALLVFADRLCAQTYDDVRDAEADHVMATFPFSSARKNCAIIYEKGDTRRYFVKGAPEVLLPGCTHVADFEKNKTVPLSRKGL